LAANIANGVNFMALPPLLPVLSAELGLDSAAAGLLFSAGPLFSTAFTVPASLLSARLGLRATYGLGLICAAGGLLVALLPTYWGVFAGRALMGVGGAVLPLASAITVQWFRGRSLPMMNSAGFVCLSLAFTAGLSVTVPLASAVGWQMTLAAFGGMAAVVAGAWWLLGGEGPYRPDPGVSVGGPSAMQVLLYPRTWLLALGFAGPIACYDTFTAWLPTYYHTALGMDLGQAATLTAVLGLAGVPGALLGGWLTARTGLRRPFLVGPGLLLPPLALAAFSVTDPAALAVVLGAFGLLAWGFNPAYVTIPMELPGYSPVAVGASLSAVFTLTGLLVFATPLAVGALVDITGSFVPGFSLCVALAFCLLVAGLVLPESGPGRAQPAATPAP
jgi:cyanate permease